MSGASPRTRNTKMVLVSMLPDDLHSLDAIAAEIAEPGMAPNRSAAVRELIRDRMAIRAKIGARKVRHPTAEARGL